VTISWRNQVGLGLSEISSIQVVLKAYEKGSSLSQIAKACRVHPISVKNLLAKQNIPRRSVGGRNYYKPLNITKEEYLNTTCRELAKKYKVSTSTINRYRKDKGWYKPKRRKKNVSI